MYLLDTDVIIDFLRGKPNVVSYLKNIIKSNELSTSFLNLCELYKGVYRSKDKILEEQKVDAFVNSIAVLQLNRFVSKRYGRINFYLYSKGKPTQDMDLMIASVAIENGAILLTKNKRHYENIPDLRLEVVN